MIIAASRRDYLLSGLLKSHLCFSNLTIVSGANPEKAKYALSFNWRRGAKACPNNIRLSRIEIEERVTTALKERVLHPQSIHRIVDLVSARLKQAKPKAQAERNTPIGKADTLEAEIQNPIQFISQSGDNSSHVVEATSARETELGLNRARIEFWSWKASCKQLKIDASYALKWMNKLGELMKSDVIRARGGIAQLIGTLTAKPVTLDETTGLLLIGKPQLSGILGIVGTGSTSNGSGGGI